MEAREAEKTLWKTRAMQFEGQVALITGAGSGIGAAVARRLAEAGAVVVGGDLRADAIEPPIVAVELDVRDEAAVVRALERTDELGGLDVLVNVAGIGSTTNAPDTPVEVWDDVLAVNARGTFLTCKHAVPRMAARGRGAIVNVASVAGMVGLRNRAAYCASKAAVVGLTRALAVDHVGDGIRVNAVCPGTVDTPWVRRLVDEAGESLDTLRARQPMGRLGTPEEIADAVLYLASDAAAFVTGSAFVIDGGLTAA
jgi:2-keto-3-deoxy-L-fuconate dehydrogenase